MKKLIALSILLVLLSAAAFAQLKVGFTSDNIVDLMYYTVNKTKDDKSEPKGSFDFLRSNYVDSNELRLTFKYTGEGYEAFLELKGDELVTRGTGFYAADADNITFLDVIARPLGDYYVKGTAGLLRGYIGNTSDRGKTNDFRFYNWDSSDDFLKTKAVPYGFGYIKTGLDFVEVNNLKPGAPWLGFGVDFDPFSVDVASNLNLVGYNAPSKSADSVAGTFRVSGEKVADLVNFDLIYRLEGNDPNSKDSLSNGKWDNSFGIYAGLTPIADLGVGIGFSGNATAYETRYDGGTDGKSARKVTGPFWAGISLNVNYAGIDKIDVTLDNNISFAGVTGGDSKDTVTYGLRGNAVGKDDKEGWFALSNLLMVTYKLSDQTSVKLHLANALGATTYTWKETPADGTSEKITEDSFGVVLSALYAFNDYISFEAGISLWNDAATTEYHGASKGETADFHLGVPLRFKVSF